MKKLLSVILMSVCIFNATELKTAAGEPPAKMSCVTGTIDDLIRRSQRAEEEALQRNDLGRTALYFLEQQKQAYQKQCEQEENER